MSRSLRLSAVITVFATLSWAAETKTWTQNEREEFEKGNLKRLSLSSDGRLSLAPQLSELLDSSSAYLWAVARDSHGNLYAGGGGPGSSKCKLYVVPAGGQGKVLAELDGMEIHALAVDARDRLYAATAPDGKVFRIAASGAGELFYDPHTKYIWAMAFDSRGNLYLATGDRGEVHRVAPNGQGAVFFRTDETHARSLAIDAHDNVLLGTEPGGLVLRVSPDGAGFVLYQASRREVTAVAAAPDGTVYAAAVGARPTSPQPAVPIPAPTPAPPAAAQAAQRAMPTPPPSFGAPALSGGSEVYRIAADGFPRAIWNHPQEVAYALAFDKNGRLLIGTGNKGIVYRLDSDVAYTLLVNTPPTQVTAFAAGPQGEVYAATGNIGKLYRLGPGLEKDGVAESEVFDAKLFSYWGRLSFRGHDQGGRIALSARSGNLDRPQKNWSPWSAPVTTEDGGRLPSPASRFVQWKAELAASADGHSPELDSVSIAYLSKNVAPLVEAIEITPSNYRFPPPSISLTASPTLTLPPLGRSAPSRPMLSLDTGSPSVTLQYAKGHIGTRWAAGDENGDTLEYGVEIRGVAEKEWKLLKDHIKDKHLSWDSTAFPDGDYRVRVTASDAPSNPPGQALTNRLESDPFTIDNTPPRISALTAAREGADFVIRWSARDERSLIDKAEYSIDGGDWLVAEPTTKVTDSRELDYRVSVPGLRPGEHTIAVRVADECNNRSVEKIVVR
jgi:hypothetical protein